MICVHILIKIPSGGAHRFRLWLVSRFLWGEPYCVRLGPTVSVLSVVVLRFECTESWSQRPFSPVALPVKQVTGEREKWAALYSYTLFTSQGKSLWGWTLRKGKQATFSFKSFSFLKTFGFRSNYSVAEGTIVLSILAENLLALCFNEFFPEVNVR